MNISKPILTKKTFKVKSCEIKAKEIEQMKMKDEKYRRSHVGYFDNQENFNKKHQK